MKCQIFKIGLTALFFFSAMLNADELAQTDSPVQKPEKATKTPFIEYHNRMTVFAPAHVAYERIKPNGLYAGIDAWLAPSVAGSTGFLGEAEFRMGYNFFYNGRDHFTPIAGVGYVQDLETKTKDTYEFSGVLVRVSHVEHHIPGIVYGTAGFLYDHEFNSIFNLGFNAKGLIGGPVNEHHFDWGSPVVGCDISLPLTFRFGRKRHWDYRIEPFELYLRGTNMSRNFFGFRGAVAYRF